MNRKLCDWLKEIKECDLVIEGDLNEQASGNVWTFGFSVEEIDSFPKQSLIDFVVNAEKIILSKWRGDGLFYCWMDDMAGRLCISSISSHFVRLPFSTEIEIASEPDLIVELMILRHRNMHSDTEGASNKLKVYVGHTMNALGHPVRRDKSARD